MTLVANLPFLSSLLLILRTQASLALLKSLSVQEVSLPKFFFIA